MLSAAPLVLASASPRRAQLLQQINVGFEVRPADIDEARQAGEEPTAYVQRMAHQKAARVAQLVGPQRAVLAADTTVVVGDSILGKPDGEADGLAMLAALSGRAHEVLTAVALAHRGRLRTVLARSLVRMRAFSPECAAAYWATGEGHDKAGGYAIQGVAGQLVERLEGSYSGVVGLPLAETAALLREAGLEAAPGRAEGVLPP